MATEAVTKPARKETIAPIRRGGRLLLLGYWGFRNAGDDLMLQTALEYAGKMRPDVQVTISARDASSLQLPAGVECIGGVGPLPKARRALALRNADAVAWLGGTCLYDNQGLPGLHRNVLRAWRMGKPFHFVNIGIGSFSTAEGDRMLREILEKCASASFRDPLSLACAEQLAPGSGKFNPGGDLVSLIEVPKKAGPKHDLQHIGFSGTREYAHDVVTLHWLESALRDLATSGCKIHFFELHGGSAGDHALHQKIAGRLPEGSYVMERPGSNDALMSRLAEMDFHIGMRLHSVILSDMVGVPGIGLAASSKVQRYLAKMRNEWRCLVIGSQIDPETLRRMQQQYRRPEVLLDAERDQAIAGMQVLFGCHTA